MVSPISAQLTTLSLVRGFAAKTESKTIIEKGVNAGAGLGSLENFFTLNFLQKSKPTFEQNEVLEAGKALDTIVDGLQSIAGNLESLRSVAFSGTSSVLTSTQVNNLVGQVDDLLAGINNVADNTQYHGFDLLNGETDALSFQVKEDSFYGFQVAVNEDFAKFKVELESFLTKDLGLNEIKVTDATSSERAVKLIDGALDQMTQFMATILEKRDLIGSKITQRSAEEVRLREVMTLTPSIDFFTNNSFFRKSQIKNLNLPYLDSGINLRGASISFKV